MGEAYSWKARGAAVRDARHVHNGPEVSGSPPVKSKDTKRWCRGKVSVEHKLAVTLEHRSYGYPRLTRYCATCGKEFGTYRGTWGSPPEWASADDLKALQVANQQASVRATAGRAAR